MAFGNGVIYAASIDLAAKAALDSRLTCATLSERDEHFTSNRAYPGMVVYVEENEKLYVLLDNTPTWVEVLSAENIINDLTTGGASAVLSAEQGKQLKAQIDSVASGSITVPVATDSKVGGILSGTGIGVVTVDGSGNASVAQVERATMLATARAIALTGDVTGSTSFDGSGNVSITATVADDSHNHVIGNVDGLQSALDGKLSTTGIAANSRKIQGTYSSSGGVIPPSEVGTYNGILRMMYLQPESSGGGGGYCDWFLMNSYAWSDVPYCTAIGVSKTATPRAFIMSGPNSTDKADWVRRELALKTDLPTGTIGSSSKPVYLLNGTITACSATVGSATTPVYLNNGTITACTSGGGGVSVSNSTSDIYILGTTGTGTLSTLNRASGVYISSGTTVNASGGFYVQSSRKYKKDIKDTEVDALKVVEDTKVVDFVYKDDENEVPRIGFIAEDTNPIMSTPNQDKMDTTNCIGVLLRAVQQLSDKVRELESAIHV